MSEKIECNPVLLKSPRLTLRPISLDGLDDFHEYSMDEEFYEYLEFPAFKNITESKEYLLKLINRSASPSQQYWFIQENLSQKVIGSFGVHSLDQSRRSIEIGYGLSSRYWSKGYFKEATNIVLDYLFIDLSLQRVVARTFETNQASIKGLERLGFQVEGIMRDYYRKHNDQWFNAILMAKLRND